MARVTVNDRFYIRLLDRFGSREVLPSIPSACSHSLVCITAHLSDTRFVLEGCMICEVICKYNIDTRERSIVHTKLIPSQMCHGPVGCILVRDGYFSNLNPTVLKFKWEKERLLHGDKEYTMDGKILELCYVESFNIFVIMNYDNEIKAEKLGNNNPIWKLSGTVGGELLKPDALTSDAQGNVYVGDGANNRILKINSLTGDIVNILLLEKENTMPIHSLFWSDTQPNLTLIRGDRISTYILKT